MVEVRDQEQAISKGMNGSPTILVDGADPFAVPGAQVTGSFSRRLYRGPDGRAEGAPSVAELRRVCEADPGSAD